MLGAREECPGRRGRTGVWKGSFDRVSVERSGVGVTLKGGTVLPENFKGSCHKQHFCSDPLVRAPTDGRRDSTSVCEGWRQRPSSRVWGHQSSSRQQGLFLFLALFLVLPFGHAFIDFREGGTETEREMSVWETNTYPLSPVRTLQPGMCSEWGTEPTTVWCTGRRSSHRSHRPGQSCFLFTDGDILGKYAD